MIYFKAKKVVMAIGGQQSVPEDVKLLGIKPKVDKNFFVSDEVLKKPGFTRLLRYIKENNVKEISIIGGSHSGLSCAWMLLNGSAMHDFKDYEEHKFDMEFFDQETETYFNQRQNYNLPKGNRKYRVIKRIKKDEENDTVEYSELGEEFEYKPWHLGGLLNHPDFCKVKIKIIYKNDIKINYKSKEEALMDGYTNFTKGVINSKGIIYPFTGLRGDAKSLWRQVKILKSENRVEFVKANTYPLQKQAIKSSDVVIWACGYESRPLPIFHFNPLANKTEICDFKRVSNYQFEVDDNLKL